MSVFTPPACCPPGDEVYFKHKTNNLHVVSVILFCFHSFLFLICNNLSSLLEFNGGFLVLQDLTALAKELRELRQGEETSRPPVKVTDYSSSSEDSHSSEDEEGEGGANDGTVAVSDIPRIM